jgi:hypothetical protein
VHERGKGLLRGHVSCTEKCGVRSWRAKSLKKVEQSRKKDAHSSQIHWEFIGLCFSEGTRAHIRVRCEKGKPVARWGRKTAQERSESVARTRPRVVLNSGQGKDGNPNVTYSCCRWRRAG